MPTVLSVKQLNLYVRSLLEGDPRLSVISVTGELSNFKPHYSSGHLYFSLKDNDALIRCVMFKGNAFNLKINLKDGDKVICTGRVSLYEKDGTYQLYVEKITPVGVGEVAEQFRIIKEKLEKEGLFSIEHKRPLPEFPKKIAVITSSTGAAVQDIINVISRRYPLCSILLCPVLVQGSLAPKSIIDALNKVYKSDADLIIIGRGGGSSEDLSAFNDEMLARFLFESPIPTISAVGHETDFTICDFVADFRAPTPSAAAEVAVPDIKDLSIKLSGLKLRLKNANQYLITKNEMRVLSFSKKEFFLNPETLFSSRQAQLNLLNERFRFAIQNIIAQKNEKLAVLASSLDAISPLKVLSRGFAAVKNDNGIVTSVSGLNAGDKIFLDFSDGNAECTVDKVNGE